MAIKNKSDLTTTNQLNITDALNKQNTAARVREVTGDIIDSSMNVVDAAISSNNLGSATGTNNGTRSTLISSDGSTITSGQSAIIASKNSSINADGAAIIGGSNNTNNGSNSLVSGFGNTVGGSQSIVGGGGNNVGSSRALVVGNSNNVNSSNAIVGGANNTINGNNALVMGRGILIEDKNYQVAYSGYYGNLYYSGASNLATRTFVNSSQVSLMTYNFGNDVPDMFKLRPGQIITIKAFGMVTNVDGDVANYDGIISLTNKGAIQASGDLDIPQLQSTVTGPGTLESVKLSFTYSNDWWSIQCKNDADYQVTASMDIQYVIKPGAA